MMEALSMGEFEQLIGEWQEIKRSLAIYLSRRYGDPLRDRLTEIDSILEKAREEGIDTLDVEVWRRMEIIRTFEKQLNSPISITSCEGERLEWQSSVTK